MPFVWLSESSVTCVLLLVSYWMAFLLFFNISNNRMSGHSKRTYIKYETTSVKVRSMYNNWIYWTVGSFINKFVWFQWEHTWLLWLITMLYLLIKVLTIDIIERFIIIGKVSLVRALIARLDSRSAIKPRSNYQQFSIYSWLSYSIDSTFFGFS